MNFSKNHLRDTRNAGDFKAFRREVFSEYASFIKDTIQNNYDWAVKFIMWLRQYLHYIMDEKKFRPTLQPKYARGQILLVNFGFRIGHELGGPHYAIVLDNDNRKKGGLVTVVPMISKKPRHETTGIRPWEYELPMPISTLIMEKAHRQLSLAPDSELTADITAAVKMLNQMEPAQQLEAIPGLAKRFESRLKNRISPLLALSKKMQKGSVVDIQQIAAVSKQRIITPVKKSDELYDVVIPEKVMERIGDMIKNEYLSAGCLDDSPKKL